MNGDLFESVRAAIFRVVPTWKERDEHLDAIARLEAEHKRLQACADSPARWAALYECLSQAENARGTPDFQAARASMASLQQEMGRLRADSERLRKALLKSCTLCHGTGTYHPHCSFCEDSGHGHECPPPVPCTHPYLPDFVRTP